MSADIPRLSAAPARLLAALSQRGVLRQTERTATGVWFALIGRDGDHERVHGRAANTLIRLGLVQRIDEFDWRISDAGRAWLACKTY